MAIITPQQGTQNDPTDWFQQFQNQEQNLNHNPPTAPGVQGGPLGLSDPNDPNSTINQILSRNGAQSSTTGTSQANTSDPAAFLQAYVQQHQNDPDFDPSLRDNPQYWIGVINANGGLDSPSKQAYWSDKFKTARGQSPSGGAGTLGSLGQGSLLSSYGQQFQQPTEQDALNSPGLQFALQQGQQGIQRSAAGRGTLLTGGTLKALDRYSVGTALQGYNDVFNRNLSQFNTNYNLWDRQRNFENDTLNQTANRGAGVSQ